MPKAKAIITIYNEDGTLCDTIEAENFMGVIVPWGQSDDARSLIPESCDQSTRVALVVSLIETLRREYHGDYVKILEHLLSGSARKLKLTNKGVIETKEHKKNGQN